MEWLGVTLSASPDNRVEYGRAIADARWIDHSRPMRPDEVLDDAIAFAANQWKVSQANGSIPANGNLSDRVTLFAGPLKKSLFANFPRLRAANDQVLLFVVAEGIARSGAVEREALEKALGIILPPD